VPRSLAAIENELPASLLQRQRQPTEILRFPHTTDEVERIQQAASIPSEMQRGRTISVVWWCCCSLLWTAPTAHAAQDTIRGDGRNAARAEQETKPTSENVFDETNANTDNGKAPPNVLIFIVDDLGWNQVGYHANPAGNLEIKTPNIDAHAAAGLALNRGYMTPW
jgi:hypothetical protein